MDEATVKQLDAKLDSLNNHLENIADVSVKLAELNTTLEPIAKGFNNGGCSSLKVVKVRLYLTMLAGVAVFSFLLTNQEKLKEKVDNISIQIARITPK